MNIFVGNLAFATTEQDLRQLFEPYGTVETIRMMTDRETGRSRGFGFVEMPDSRAAQSAIDALNGTSLER
jgi:RNA recognition motif-containing protein